MLVMVTFPVKPPCHCEVIEYVTPHPAAA